MVRQEDVGPGLRGDVAETPGRVAVILVPEARRAVGRDVPRRSALPVESGPTPQRRHVRSAAILHRDDRRNRSQRVTRCQVQRERGIAERQLLTIGRHDVALRLRPAAGVGFEELPVRRAHHDTGAEPLLEEPRAGHVIAVGMADEDVPDALRIQPQFHQPVDHLLFH